MLVLLKSLRFDPFELRKFLFLETLSGVEVSLSGFTELCLNSTCGPAVLFLCDLPQRSRKGVVEWSLLSFIDILD